MKVIRPLFILLLAVGLMGQRAHENPGKDMQIGTSNIVTGAATIASTELDLLDTMTAKTGDDFSFVTGTEGSTGNCAQWNVDGDLVTSGASCGGATSLSDITAAIGTNTIDNVEFDQDWNWNTPSTAAVFDGMTFGLIFDTADDGGPQNLVRIVQLDGGNDAAGQPESLLLIENLDSTVNDAVVAGIELRATTALAMPIAVDASDAEIVIALAIGSNTITTTASSIASTELDLLDTMTAKTGNDLSFVTGTAGVGGRCAEWNGDGDLVEAASAAACGTGGATRLDQILPATATNTIDNVEFDQDWNWNTPSTAAVFDGMTFGLIFDTADDGGAQNLVRIVQLDGGNDAANQPESLLLIENLDTTVDDAVVAGIELRATTALAMPIAIDATDAEIVTALAIGSNTITTTSSTIAATELDILDGGILWDEITAPAGNLTLAMGTNISTFNNTQTGDVTHRPWVFTYNYTNAASTQTQDFFSIRRLDSGADQADIDSLMVIENLDTDDRVVAGLVILSAAGRITTGLRVADLEIDNAVDIGPNAILTAAQTILSTELDRLFDVDAALVDLADTPTWGGTHTFPALELSEGNILNVGLIEVDTIAPDEMAMTIGDGGGTVTVNGTLGIPMTTSATECVMLHAQASVQPAAETSVITLVEGTNFPYNVVEFDDTLDEIISWNYELPENIIGTTATVEIAWLTVACTAATADDVCWVWNGGGFLDDDAFNTGAFSGSEAAVQDKCTTVGDIHTTGGTSWTHGYDVAAPKDTSAVFQIQREQVADASCTGDNDDISGDVRLKSVRICYEVENVFSGEGG
ncbi:MAG: hypothetical protein V3R16_02450 [Nitrospirales bacterium]